ncbi:MAG: STAS-like domain-containing protein [Elusimicrobia bacterium]|nr:STAS-like domain-containing protein [Elusimicrobiota bacterium]
MRIKLKRFGSILTSRPAGREAALAIKAYQRPDADENIEIDFEGVLSVGPSWLDEVLSELRREFGSSRVICLPTKNPSAIESLRVIDS